MMVNPKKLQLGREVVFGGMKIKDCRQRDDKRTTVYYMSPTEEKPRTFLDINSSSSKSEVQKNAGIAAQIRKFVPGLMITFPGIKRMMAQNMPFIWTPQSCRRS